MAEGELVRLPAVERAKRYRACARETLRLAEMATKPEIRATFINLSACWMSLAREAERTAHLDPGRLSAH
jgi:hypothetical protein